MKLFNLLRYLIEAIAGALFGQDSHSGTRYSADGVSVIKAVAGENIYSGAMVCLKTNPDRKKWQFWKPKKVAFGTFTEPKLSSKTVLIDLKTMKVLKVVK